MPRKACPSYWFLQLQKGESETILPIYIRILFYGIVVVFLRKVGQAKHASTRERRTVNKWSEIEYLVVTSNEVN